MNQEIWKIKYVMKTSTGSHCVEERFPVISGYHNRLVDISHREGCEQPNPLYKVRGDVNEGCGFVFADWFMNDRGWNGWVLPINDHQSLRNGELICDEDNPIIFTAPNGARYISIGV